MKHRFRSVIEQARGPGATVARVPDQDVAGLGGFNQKRAKGTVNGVPFTTATFPYNGEGLWIGVPKATRIAAGAELGDEVEIEIEIDESPREIALPTELEAAFGAEPELRRKFEALSWSRKRLIFEPLAEAKMPETRRARLKKALADLRQG
jgi:bifunctional DNA-binding transcriptional regulator/antitoxin component of YhaV-PrlF toxin-antitoxin module